MSAIPPATGRASTTSNGVRRSDGRRSAPAKGTMTRTRATASAARRLPRDRNSIQYSSGTMRRASTRVRLGRSPRPNRMPRGLRTCSCISFTRAQAVGAS